VTHDVRDEVVDYVRHWSRRTELATMRLVKWIGVGMSKFYDWRNRYGQVNEHNALVPRDHWLETWERQAIVAFHGQHPLEGYRRLTYMMMDADVVAASPATVYRVLKGAGCFHRWNRTPTGKGQGFQQPLQPHEHWHVDISYVNVCGTFYYLTSVLDGCSRFLVHGELRVTMREADVEVVLQRARERFPDVHPRIISDNGPQFIARDFHEFIRLCGMTHVKTSPYYPQSNGKIERWHQTLKADCIRPHVPLSLEEARELIEGFVAHYNHVRLHSAIGYVTPADKLAGREAGIFAERDRKLEAARERRRQARQLASTLASTLAFTQGDALQHQTTWAEDRATQRCDPSADPGVGVKRRAGPRIGASPLHPSLQHQSAKPDWQDAAVPVGTTPFNSLTPRDQDSSSR
jgi:transposase InsO family protein